MNLEDPRGSHALMLMTGSRSLQEPTTFLVVEEGAWAPVQAPTELQGLTPCPSTWSSFSLALCLCQWHQSFAGLRSRTGKDLDAV